MQAAGLLSVIKIQRDFDKWETIFQALFLLKILRFI